jgi:hypothetical protein
MAYFTETERPTERPAEVGTRFTHKCPVCGGAWSIVFPPGVEVVAKADAECEQCRGKAPAVPPT